jgi:hypothetical protein
MSLLCRHVNFVCGGDDQTYTNPCMADCRNVTVACQGPCPCQANPSSSVSGNSYQSFHIESLADCRNVTVAPVLAKPIPAPVFQVIVTAPSI